MDEFTRSMMQKDNNMKAQRITIAIADDHAILRQGLQSLISQEKDLEVVGEASNGHETLELVKSKNPDILILDIAMPNLNGIEVSKRVKKNFAATKIIILSMYDDQEYIVELFACGVSGYLPKESVASDLIAAIRSVNKGDFYLSPSISKKVINNFLLTGSKPQGTKDNLTKRELEILQLIAEGYSSREIGDLVNTSKRTIDTHRNNIMKKLNIHRKTDLVKYAIKQGIIKIHNGIGNEQ